MPRSVLSGPGNQGYPGALQGWPACDLPGQLLAEGADCALRSVLGRGSPSQSISRPTAAPLFSSRPRNRPMRFGRLRSRVAPHALRVVCKTCADVVKKVLMPGEREPAESWGIKAPEEL